MAPCQTLASSAYKYPMTATVPPDVLAEIGAAAEREWPDDREMQQWMIDREAKAWVTGRDSASVNS